VNAGDVFNTIFRFLNLEDFLIEKPEKLRSGTYSKLSNETRAKLAEFYKSKNLQLYNTIGRNLEWEKQT